MSARDELAALIGSEPWPSSWDRETHLAIADAVLAAGWVQLRQCDHQWMTFGTIHPDAGPPWRECSSCGRDEPLTADEDAYDQAWQARDWDEVSRIQDKWAGRALD